MSDAPLIVYRGVKKRFGDNVVLDGVDLDVARGETIAILGASGSGKTVLIKTLVGLVRVDEGSVTFDGIDVALADERMLRAVRARIGFVFQAAALFDSVTVGDNVAYPLRIRGESRGRIAERVTECLDLVGLAGTADMMPGDLSGGMRKRVAVARALATRPELLLYDEPTTGLDPANVQRIGALIVSVRASSRTTGIVVTHDRALAFAVADRIALLAAGRIAWLGTNGQAQKQPPPLAAFWGTGVEQRP
jgi:phospholipid/cholesterol/gamma-HCH transport system ATP-binding protein